MTDPITQSRSESDESAGAPQVPASESLLESDVLVEEISIDGMCGVY